MSRHLAWFLQIKEEKKGRCDIRQDAVGNLETGAIFRYVDKVNEVGRMGSVRRTIGIAHEADDHLLLLRWLWLL